MSTTTLPYDWLKEVPTALLQMDDIPLLGFPPDFPWPEFSQKLKEVFQVQQFEVTPLNLQWRSPADLFSSLAEDLIPIHFQIPSLEGDLCIVLAKRDVLLLMSQLLTKQKEPLDEIDPEFQDGFVHFLAYELIYIFNQCNFDKSLNPHILEKTENSDEDLKKCFYKEKTLFAKTSPLQLMTLLLFVGFLISNEFRKSWKEKYAARTLDIPLQSSLAKKIHIPVAIEAGRTSLTLSEWKQIGLGDFLILDSCSLDPENDKGKVMLTVNGNHFFRARLKDGEIKLLEHPLFFEGHLNQDSTFEKIETQEAKNNMAKDKYEEPSEMEDFTFDMDDEESETSEESLTEDKDENTFEQENEEETEKTPSNSANSKFVADEMMLDVIVEVGRIEMSIQKLTELVPGNILEIDVRPENGVDLVVNGKRIGKGELLKLGEVLGVRILDI